MCESCGTDCCRYSVAPMPAAPGLNAAGAPNRAARETAGRFGLEIVDVFRQDAEACRCVYPDKCSCEPTEVDDELCADGKTPAECAEWPEDCKLFPYPPDDESYSVKETLEAKLVSLNQDRERVLAATVVLFGRTMFEMNMGLDKAEEGLVELLNDIDNEIAETVSDWLDA